MQEAEYMHSWEGAGHRDFNIFKLLQTKLQIRNGIYIKLWNLTQVPGVQVMRLWDAPVYCTAHSQGENSIGRCRSFSALIIRLKSGMLPTPLVKGTACLRNCQTCCSLLFGLLLLPSDTELPLPSTSELFIFSLLKCSYLKIWNIRPKLPDPVFKWISENITLSTESQNIDKQ